MLNKHHLILDLRLVLTTFVCLVLSLHESGAVVLRHDKDDADVLRLGRRFEAVGRLLPDGGCTLIAPRWVATAAHVARSLKIDSKIQFGDKKYAVKRTVPHPKGAKRKGRPPEVDLALVEFAEPVKNIKSIELYRKGKEAGQTLFIVGYGDYGNPRTGLKRTDGKRRAVTNVVHDAGPRRIFMKFDEPPKGTEYEGVGGPGDSGGPALNPPVCTRKLISKPNCTKAIREQFAFGSHPWKTWTFSPMLVIGDRKINMSFITHLSPMCSRPIMQTR